MNIEDKIRKDPPINAQDFGVPPMFAEMAESYARWAVAMEREACAKVCEAEASRAEWNWDNDISGNQPFWNGGEQLASSCADVIRARGNG